MASWATTRGATIAARHQEEPAGRFRRLVILVAPTGLGDLELRWITGVIHGALIGTFTRHVAEDSSESDQRYIRFAEEMIALLSEGLPARAETLRTDPDDL